MILVFASIFNKAAASFVSNYKGVAASLITCSSLSLTETRISYPDVDGSFITVDDTRLYLKDVRGIINLLPGILPEEMYFYNEHRICVPGAGIYRTVSLYAKCIRCACHQQAVSA